MAKKEAVSLASQREAKETAFCKCLLFEELKSIVSTCRLHFYRIFCLTA